MSQEFGKGLAGRFWLTASQAVVVRYRTAGSWSPWRLLAWQLKASRGRVPASKVDASLLFMT